MINVLLSIAFVIFMVAGILVLLTSLIICIRKAYINYDSGDFIEMVFSIIFGVVSLVLLIVLIRGLIAL